MLYSQIIHQTLYLKTYQKICGIMNTESILKQSCCLKNIFSVYLFKRPLRIHTKTLYRYKYATLRSFYHNRVFFGTVTIIYRHILYIILVYIICRIANIIQISYVVPSGKWALTWLQSRKTQWIGSVFFDTPRKVQ